MPPHPRFSERATHHALSERAIDAPFFFQHHVVATLLELDARHEGPHQQHAAAAGTTQPRRRGGVGQCAGIETGALVGDLDANFVGESWQANRTCLAASRALPCEMALSIAL